LGSSAILTQIKDTVLVCVPLLKVKTAFAIGLIFGPRELPWCYFDVVARLVYHGCCVYFCVHDVTEEFVAAIREV
jgi:hypothetical protein